MLKILFFALVIGLGMRAVRALFSPRGPAQPVQGARGRRRAPPGASGPGPAGPTIKDVPKTDYRWDGNDKGPQSPT